MEDLEKTNAETTETARRYAALRMEFVYFAQQDVVCASGESDDKEEEDFF